MTADAAEASAGRSGLEAGMSSAFRFPCEKGVVRSGEAERPCSRSAEPWILAATVLASSMVFIDGMIVNLALPQIQRELGATLADAQWLVEAYLLFLAALLLIGGSLGDRYGRKRIFLIGTAAFSLASLLCGVAPGVEELIVARAVQGVGGALLVPGSLAILTAAFLKDRRGRAFGTWSAFTAVSTGVGPVLGGWIVEALSWRWCFFLNLPLGAAVLAITVWQVPESRAERPAGSLDWGGAALSVIGLGGVVFGLIEAGAAGLGHPLVIGPAIAGALALIWFVFHERQAHAPMMPLSLFSSRTFAGANLLTLFLYGAMSAVFFFLPLNLIQVQGYSASGAGAAMTPAVVVSFALSRWAGSLVDRFGSKLPLTVGPLVAGAGFFLCVLPGVGGSYWTTFFPAIVVFGVGMAISVAPLTTTVMNAVPDEQAGVASGVNNAVSRTAGLLAIAALSVFVSMTFNTALDARLDSVDLTAAAAAELDAERPKLGAAEVPPGLTESQQSVVSAAIDESFVEAFQLVAIFATGLAVLSSFSAWAMVEGKRAAE